MNFKKYHVSRNLLNNVLASVEDSGIRLTVNPDKSITINGSLTAGTQKAFSIGTIVAENGKDYTISGITGFTTSTLQMLTDSSIAFPSGNRLLCFNGAITRTSYGNESCTVKLYVYSGVTYNNVIIYPMVTQSSTPQPYEPYSSEVWHDTPHYIHNTSTDTITTPADIYANDTTATIGLKGQMVQSGTPTPTSPIQPQECGDLETTGEHTGQYKIPILNNSQTTNVYLGEVQSTRRIKKLVLTGEENIVYASVTQGNLFRYQTNDYIGLEGNINGICSHYPVVTRANRANKTLSGNAGITVMQFDFIDNDYSDITEFKAYLAAQYAAGTPVTVWYVLATPETAVVNEPIRKIGDYADEVSGITIPVTAGANTLSIGTTVQPSEVTATYKGWHPVSAVHERENGAWT